MADGDRSRANQKRRTRKDLLDAAARLMKAGGKPSLEEVAEAAMVSRATAYRYFPSIEALLAEASVDVVFPTPAQVFDPPSHDVARRLQQVDQALHDMVLANEAPLRLMLASTLTEAARGADVPARQNRRSPLIEAALAPMRDQFAPDVAEKLAQAVALLVGVESMIVFKDVLQLDDARAREVKRWAIEALVRGARS
ncbi:TetR/AcrR family transcriptional regulator [Phenylobacterium sp.]|uniref:TetR/AcrR family transcriptional regulator n=1 Tax=Phenylobacterium sp. TaxID=1871053 RepID=UPI0035B1CE6E